MKKHLLFGLALCALVSCEEATIRGTADAPPELPKSALQKLRWVEGTWQSVVSGPGFYQTYYFPTDSTLEIVSYQFDGKDTSATTYATVYWKNHHIYLGPTGEWVAVLLGKDSFRLDPIRPSWHSISWSRDKEKDDEWTAQHKRPDFERTIKMKRTQPLDSMLTKAAKATE